MATQKQIDAIIKFVEVYLERDKAYDKMNSVIRNTIPNFTPYVMMEDADVISEFFEVIKAMLDGDETVDYFVYECQDEEGGKMWVNDKEYPIKTIADLRKYLEAECLTKQPNT